MYTELDGRDAGSDRHSVDSHTTLLKDWRARRSFARIAARTFAYPFGRLALRGYHISGGPAWLWATRTLLDIQLSTAEIAIVHTAIQTHHCNAKLLVFGLGRDSVFWQTANAGGQTVFVEDNQEWYDCVLKRHKSLKAFLIKYTTRKGDFSAEVATDVASRQPLHLPAEISSQRWDVILVDAPAGHSGGDPGRIQSIFAARQLAAPGGDVFVHDVNRDIERACCDTFFSNATLCESVGRMRHYRV